LRCKIKHIAPRIGSDASVMKTMIRILRLFHLFQIYENACCQRREWANEKIALEKL